MIQIHLMNLKMPSKLNNKIKKLKDAKIKIIEI